MVVKKSNILKVILATCVGLVMIFPHIQSVTKLFQSSPLDGYVTPEQGERLSLKSWFSGNFQEGFNQEVNTDFGFRNNLVRLNNEISFRLFNKSTSSYIIVGKENYLFEEWYINAHIGHDFLGRDSIRRKLHKLKQVQDTLASLGKTLITIYAPGKAAFYPEYIPNNYLNSIDSTNIETYLDLSNSIGINHIDFHSYFISQKGKHQYPIYPKNGTHWSYYSMCLAADSILKRIEHDRSIDIPNVVWDKIEKDVERESDYDIAKTMNLFSTIKGDSMGYPNIKVENDSNLFKPKVIVISDSYYFGMFNFGLAQAFQNNRLRYYNKQILPDSYTSELTTAEISLEEEIKNTDVIYIVCTDVNLSRLGWGYIEDAYSLFYE